jgi:hypothetical protein
MRASDTWKGLSRKRLALFSSATLGEVLLTFLWTTQSDTLLARGDLLAPAELLQRNESC